MKPELSFEMSNDSWKKKTGTSVATVTESLVIMNICALSWRCLFCSASCQASWVAVAAILARQPDDRSRQWTLVRCSDRLVALAGAGLAKHPAGPSFGGPMGLLDMVHTASAALGAYQFPSAASFKISLSKVRSATACFRRLFSCSRSFSRRAWSTLRPPYSRRQR